MTPAFIFNADDYGLTSGVSHGIRQAHQRGLVTSTTAMMNFPDAEPALRAALKETPGLGLGVHLVLTAGAPRLRRIPSLVGAQGRFRRLSAQTANVHSLNQAAVHAEWRAQIESFVAATGRVPDHLDSHHHFAYFTPALFRTLLQLAQEYNCAIRYPLADAPNVIPAQLREGMLAAAPRLLDEFAPKMPTHFVDSFYGENTTAEHLGDILANPVDGVLEVMCHPAFVDADLRAISSYQDARQRELEILCESRSLVPKMNLTNFGRLGQ